MSLTETASVPSAASPAESGFVPRPPRVYHRFDPSRVVGTMTVDEWDIFVRQAKHKYNYVNGKVVQMAGASPEHNLLCSNILVELRICMDAINNPCEVLGSDQHVFARNNLYYFPDLVVVCGAMEVDGRDALRNPAAIVEVLSPTTKNDDRGEKFREYQDIASLTHYILIDQDAVAVTHYEKIPGGLWAIRGDYRALSDTLNLTFGGETVRVPVARIYRNVPLPEHTEAAIHI